jgi:hypothetical protein
MIRTHALMLDEILNDANNSVDVLAKLKEAYKISYVKDYMELCVSDKWTSIEVDSIDVKSFDYHRSMCGAFLLNKRTWDVLSIVIMGGTVFSNIKEKQYKALSEMLYSRESVILKYILKKDLSELYPNLTHELISTSLN